MTLTGLILEAQDKVRAFEQTQLHFHQRFGARPSQLSTVVIKH